MVKGKSHPGFEGAAKSVARKEGIPMESARAIIGKASHEASPKAVKANPNLTKVPGVKKPK